MSEQPYDQFYDRNAVYRAPSMGVSARYEPQGDDPKPWAAWPDGEFFDNTIQIAWGRTPEEALAQWNALYFNVEGKHTFAGRTDMTDWQKVKEREQV